MTPKGELYESGIDYAELLIRVEHDHELLRELLAIFIESYPQSYRRLLDAISECDAQRARECAHALKGMLGALSFWRAVRTTYEIERAAANGVVDGLAEKAEVLQREVLDGERALETLNAGSKS
jgi:HPt (histidine-containing phosphotransfer) domain-containing protein